MTAFYHRRQGFWWLVLLEGLIGIGVGVVAFTWPELTAMVLLVFIAAWAIRTGIFELAAAVQLRKVMAGEWFLGLAGALSILIGVLLIANPGTGILALIWLVGIYAVLFGLLLEKGGIHHEFQKGRLSECVKGKNRRMERGDGQIGCKGKAGGCQIQN